MPKILASKYELYRLRLTFSTAFNRSRLRAVDAGLPRIGEIVELSSTENPQAKTAKFEIISFDPIPGLIEARGMRAESRRRTYLPSDVIATNTLQAIAQPSVRRS